jgi:hypothetical protein
MKKIRPSIAIALGVVGILITILAYGLAISGIISLFK